MNRLLRRSALALLVLGAGCKTSSPDRSIAPAPDTTPVFREPAALPPHVAAASALTERLHFEPNLGQSTEGVRFFSHGPGYSLFLSPREADLVMLAPQTGKTDPQRSGASVRMKLLGASDAPRIAGLDPLSAVTNYFVGNVPEKWLSNVPHYGRVQYRDVYPGIDVTWHGSNSRELEYDFSVAPGADPGAILLEFAGATGLSLDAHGNLSLATTVGPVTQKAPAAWQEIGGLRSPVAVAFRLDGTQLRFDVGAHDPSLPLVIDPALSYFTDLQQSAFDERAHVAVDGAGNTYVAGVSRIPTGPFDLSGNANAFVTRVDPSGNPVSTTILGGSDGSERANGVAVDAGGDVFLVGTTDSPTFPRVKPVLPGAGGGLDAFVTELSPAGALLFSDYLGGAGTEHGAAIAVDPNGDFYVTGDTDSANFPLTAAFQNQRGDTGYNPAPDQRDAFVTRFHRAVPFITGAVSYHHVYSTYLGGASPDVGSSIAVDASGDAYVAGSTQSQFPFPGNLLGGWDAFLVEINPAGSALVFSRRLGGTLDDESHGIARDPSGNLWITGQTTSTNLPTTADAVQGTSGGGQRGFVAEFSATGAPLYATYWGGSGTDSGNAIAANALGAYVTGTTTSPNFRTDNSPPTIGPSTTFGRAFVSHLVPGRVVYSMFLGTGAGSRGNGIAVDAVGNAWVSGGDGVLEGIPAFVARISPLAAANVAGTTPEDSPPVSITLSATHVDGGALTFSVVPGSGPAHGTFTAPSPSVCTLANFVMTCTATLTYTPAANFFGLDTFAWTAATAGDTLVSPPATVSIDVTPINDPPVAVAQTVSLLEDSAVSIPLVATDIDSISLSLALLPGTGPFHGTLSPTILSPVCVPPVTPGSVAGQCTASVTYTPNPDYYGPDFFQFRANDGALDSTPGAVAITVVNVNDPPVAAADSYSTSQEALLAVPGPGLLANDTDPDGDPLTPVLGTAPAHGALTLQANGGFSYTPAAGFSGTDTFTYRANDGTILSNEVMVSIAVSTVTRPDSVATIEGTPVTTAVTANDPGVDLAPPPSAEVHYCYDGLDAACGGANTAGARVSAGRLSRVSDKAGSVETGYDGAGRAVSESRTFATNPSASFATSTVFDDNGNAASVTYPGGVRIDRVFDGANRELAIFAAAGASSELVATINAWFPFGGLRSWQSAGDTVDLGIAEDAAGWITSTFAMAPVPEDVSYAYGSDGNVKAIPANASAPDVLHDSLSRLTYDRGRAFVYDDAGNRLSGPGGAINYPDPASDRWTTANGVAYLFDAAGNVTSRGATKITTADDGTVTAFETSPAGRTRELRDYRNLRVARAGAAGEEAYFSSGGGDLVQKNGAEIARTCAPGLTRPIAPIETYVYAGGRRLAVVKSELQGTCGGTGTAGGTAVVQGVYLYFADKMDLPRAVYRASDGKQVWFGDFDAFGNALFVDEDPDANGVAFTNDFRLPGQIALRAAEGGAGGGGLLENWNRVYDAAVGRYLRADPEIDTRAFKRSNPQDGPYAYAAASPLSFSDPMGLAAGLCCRPIGNAIIGALGFKHCYLKGEHGNVWSLLDYDGVAKHGKDLKREVLPPSPNDPCAECKSRKCTTPDACFGEKDQAYPTTTYPTGAFGLKDIANGMGDEANSNTYAFHIFGSCCEAGPGGKLPNNLGNAPGWNLSPPQ